MCVSVLLFIQLNLIFFDSLNMYKEVLQKWSAVRQPSHFSFLERLFIHLATKKTPFSPFPRVSDSVLSHTAFLAEWFVPAPFHVPVTVSAGFCIIANYFGSCNWQLNWHSPKVNRLGV